MFAEYLPSNKRGRYLVLLESFWALGTIAAAGLAWLIVPHLGWRWLLAISALPGILIFFIRRSIPESPRYLLVKGQDKRAAQVISLVASENGHPLEAFTLKPLQQTRLPRVADLWRSDMRRTTLLLWVVLKLQRFSLGYYGVFTWLPNFFRAQGMALLPVYQNTFILALAQLPWLFLSRLSGRTLGTTTYINLLSNRQRHIHLSLRHRHLAQLDHQHRCLDVVLHTRCLGCLIRVHPRGLSDHPARYRYGRS